MPLIFHLISLPQRKSYMKNLLRTLYFTMRLCTRTVQVVYGSRISHTHGPGEQREGPLSPKIPTLLRHVRILIVDGYKLESWN